MKLSEHARQRSQQRGIPYEAMRLIVDFGTAVHRPGGAEEYVMRRQDVVRLLRHLHDCLQLADKLEGKRVLLSRDGCVITTYNVTA